MIVPLTRLIFIRQLASIRGFCSHILKWQIVACMNPLLAVDQWSIKQMRATNGYICTSLTPTFFSGKYVTTPDQPSHLHHLNTSQIYNVEICEVYLLVGILGNILVLVNIKMHAWWYFDVWLPWYKCQLDSWWIIDVQHIHTYVKSVTTCIL